MQTIEAKTTEKQNKIAKETIKSFITLAMYYDLHKTKEVLYQLCTKIISNQDNQVESQYLSTAKHFSLPPTFQNEINQMQNNYLK